MEPPLDKVVDVPLIINDEFQQYMMFENLDVPQIQFIYIRLVFQLGRRDRYQQCMPSSSRCSFWTWFLTCPLWCFDRCVFRWCSKLWLFRSCISSTVVDIPFVPQRQIPMVQTIQQTTDTPQLLFVFRWSFSGGRCPCCAGRVPYCDTAIVPKIHQLALDSQGSRARRDGWEQLTLPAGQCDTLLFLRPTVENSTTKSHDASTRRPPRSLV